jgi:phosphoserine phosphatase RsbU/P
VDYLTKPVHGEEVLARVRVHLRIGANNRAMIAEHRARLEQLRHAQQSILVQPEDCLEANFAVFFAPLEAAGGDFYDVVPISEEVFAYFVADVSGHGVSAAFLTSAVKALLRQYSTPLYSPEDVMRGVDSVMRQLLGEEQYLTACYARLNKRTRHLSVVSAGHPPLIHVTAAGQAQMVEADSEPLGVFSSVVLQNKELRVSNGDRFYLYSDGLIEASSGSGRPDGLKRLLECCVRHGKAPLKEAVNSIASELRPEGRAVEDDLLLLASEVRL